MLYKITTLLFIILLYTTAIFSQDVKFSQYYKNPLYLNPALTGFSSSGRLILNYQNQWTGMQNSYNTYSVSYDKTLNTINGFGLMAMSDVQGGGIYRINRLSVSYSHKIKLSPKLFFAAGFQTSYSQRIVDNSSIITASMINPFNGTVASTGSYTIANSNIIDLSTGGLLWNKNMYFGFAAHHIAKFMLNTDNIANNQLQPKYTTFFGITIALDNSGLIKNKLYLSPDIIMQYQGGHNQIGAGAKLLYERIFTAIHLTQDLGINFDTANLMLGFNNQKLKFAYSYDFTLSKLFMTAPGSHELSLILLLGSGFNFRQSKAVKCPSI